MNQCLLRKKQKQKKSSMSASPALLVNRRRSVSAAVISASPNNNNRSSAVHASHGFGSVSPLNNKSHSKTATQILAEEHKHRQEIINALKNVAIPGVTVNEQIKEGEEY